MNPPHKHLSLITARPILALGLALAIPPPAVAQATKAFPTAEGFGARAVGGRGGRVIEVTNLDDSGEGSLRSAMEAVGPRIVVFRVSGTITLESAIRVSAPYLTVAGQTSPGGVQIKGNGKPEGDWGVWFVNGAHDIIVRHLRVRMGGNLKHDAGNNSLNNVIYNWSGNNASVFGQFALNSSAFGNVVGNLWLRGPEGGYPYLNVGNGGPVRIDGSAADAGGTKLYLAGNWGPKSPTGSTNDWVGHGVNTWDYYERNHDGMPDAWELARGLDPRNPGDGAAVADNGYTHIENYLNELAGDPIP